MAGGAHKSRPIMCVLLYKPKGVKIPPYNILKACALANPHGNGFASERDDFRSLDFEKFYDRVQSVDTNEACILHFRLATHGSVRPSNCHPFKKGDIYFAHNGILDITPYKDKTDSETAFIKYVYPVAEKYGIDSDETAYAVSQIIGSSRFALMQGDKVRLFGDFIEIGGIYFSNVRFRYYL